MITSVDIVNKMFYVNDVNNPYCTHATPFVPTGTTIAVQTNRNGPVDMQALVSRIAALVQASPVLKPQRVEPA